MRERRDKRRGTQHRDEEGDVSEREHGSLVVGEWEARIASHSRNNKESCGSFWCPTRIPTSIDVLKERE